MVKFLLPLSRGMTAADRNLDSIDHVWALAILHETTRLLARF
jgi:hypothetical protein